jgi:uncharacterized repeat protein (TIGR01451 family)
VHGGEAVFVDLVDADRNRDASAVDSVELTISALGGDRETLVLAETDIDSGRFVGYVQTRAGGAAVGDCVLDVQRDGELTASYVDALDSSDAATADALVDPFGIVFDSQTGQPVDGARVRLVGAGSGAAATVLGDDGVSSFPAELITGQSVTDAGGTAYSLPAGVFRFPLVAAGDYRLVVEPPAGYRGPSTVPEARLQTLPGAPFALSPASFGNPIAIAGEIPQAIDIPLDPESSSLFLDKRTGLDVAAIGDFVPYTVTVRNATAGAPLTNVVVTDSLPPGLRYQAGSARLDATVPLEPEISADGSTLTFHLPDLAAQRSATVRYVAVVVTGAVGGTLVNRANRARRRRQRVERRERGRAAPRGAVHDLLAAARPHSRRHLRRERRRHRRRCGRARLPRGRPLRRHRRRRQVPFRRSDAGLARRAARPDHSARGARAPALR